MNKETIIYGVDNIYTLQINSWSGATQTLDKVIEQGYEEQALELINGFIGEGVNETELNDYIWFDHYDLGYNGLVDDLKEIYNIDLWSEENE